LDDTYILAAGSGSWKWELEVGKRSQEQKSDRTSKKRSHIKKAIARAKTNRYVKLA
jgi:hypothetical protein